VCDGAEAEAADFLVRFDMVAGLFFDIVLGIVLDMIVGFVAGFFVGPCGHLS
jgi:hypothetical protein